MQLLNLALIISLVALISAQNDSAVQDSLSAALSNLTSPSFDFNLSEKEPPDDPYLARRRVSGRWYRWVFYRYRRPNDDWHAVSALAGDCIVMYTNIVSAP